MDESKQASSDTARGSERATDLVAQLKALIDSVRAETTRSREAISRLDSTDRHHRRHDRGVGQRRS